jgi:galactokinase
VNLIGEHTDYNDGLVLPFALGRSVTVAAAADGGGLLRLRSRRAGRATVSVRLDELEPGSVPGWAAYPAAAAWALRAAGRPVPGACLTIESDLPQGAGLSSSAALICAVIGALADLAGPPLARPVLAALARQAENDFVGVPCGIMDQFAVLFSEAGHALLLDCRTGDHWAIPLDPAAAGLSLMIIDTGIRHRLTGGDYASRREQCERAASLLHVATLREITSTAGLAGLADPLLVSRARHVVTENRRVGQAAALLRAGRLAESGPLLTQSHVSLRDDFEVSWPQADEAVRAALAAGALGARMTGAGFGGYVLALVPADGTRGVEASVRSALAGPGRPGPA